MNKSQKEAFRFFVAGSLVAAIFFAAGYIVAWGANRGIAKLATDFAGSTASTASMAMVPAAGQPAVVEAETVDEPKVAEEEAVAPAEVVEVEVQTPADFYDIDPELINFENENDSNMSYTCKAGDLAVVFSMDPGNFQGYSTGELGAAMGAECSEGKVINITTPHWSPSALHWQVHGVAIVSKDLDPKEYTLTVADNDGKKLAVFFPLDGKAEVLLSMNMNQ